MNTIPATEENLRTENDVHPFDEDLPKKLEPTMHPVLVDGIRVLPPLAPLEPTVTGLSSP